MKIETDSPVKDAMEITAVSIRDDDIASGLSLKTNQRKLGDRQSTHRRNLTLNNKISYHPTTDGVLSERLPKEETKKRYI